MTETLLWLLYVVGAAAAFAAVHRLRWGIVPSTVAGAVPALLGRVALYFTMAEDDRPNFWRLDLSMNLSFAIIFAACGAALAMFVLSRQREG